MKKITATGGIALVTLTLVVPFAAAQQKAMPILPSHQLTPGTHTYASLTQVCAQHDTYVLTLDMQKAVFKRYGLSWSEHNQYVVDHLIPLDLGGTNTLSNLWPLPVAQQAAKAKAGYQVHDLVCTVHIGTLHAAQVAMATNWTVALHHLVVPITPRPHVPKDGTFRVGSQIDAGVYTAPGGPDCYWERDSDASESVDAIIGTGFGETDPIVTIAPTDVLFETDACGTWTALAVTR